MAQLGKLRRFSRGLSHLGRGGLAGAAPPARRRSSARPTPRRRRRSCASRRPRWPGLQIRISVNLNFELHRTSELHFLLKLRTSPNFRTFSSNFQKMLHFGKIPKKFGRNLAKIRQNLANFAKISSKGKTANFDSSFKLSAPLTSCRSPLRNGTTPLTNGTK